MTNILPHEQHVSSRHIRLVNFGQMQRNSVKVNKLIKLKKLQIADFVFVLGCVCSTRIQKIVIITIAKD